MYIQSLSMEESDYTKFRSFRDEPLADPLIYDTNNVKETLGYGDGVCPECGRPADFNYEKFFTVCKSCGTRFSRESDFAYKP
jgi:hydrogenase maturation factor HypF (carbamoyltransferase family)